MPWFLKPRSEIKKISSNHLLKTNSWVQCKQCEAVLYKKEWEDALKVCPDCNYHSRLTARERIDILIDSNTFVEHDANWYSLDPLKFESLDEPYPNKLIRTQEKTKLKDSVICGQGLISTIPIQICVMDFGFFGGSLGAVAGEKIVSAIHRSCDKRMPLIIVSASGGARMQEGIISLMQMAKTSMALTRLDNLHLPYISVLTHPTMGGVCASFASLGDVNIAEQSALIGFAGPRVIEQTIKQQLPSGFQSAEFLIQHGFIDLIVHRKNMKQQLTYFIQWFT